ncbi:MAG: cobalamin B12-binding domain-containing protein [Methylovulum sp.]|nr:cobalamin B12-binding domain-containing protein [Methylovulum sp.]MCF7998133.1 cobalamin B12-binding domain-containing protein [Methylovulum sp.]
MLEENIPKRILIGKVGLDGHHRGAKYVTNILRAAGYEVIYTGIRKSPEQIVASAIQEDVAMIGLSFLSGAHLPLFHQVVDLLKAQDADDIILVGGGVIPPDDLAALKAMGVAEVFTPGVADQNIIEKVAALLKD